MITPELLKNKNILLRADLDIPIEQGKLTNTYRLERLLPTLNLCLQNAAHTLIIGHAGRPQGVDLRFSLDYARKWLEKAMNQSITFISSGFSPGEWARGTSPISMLENLRFFKGELGEDPQFIPDLCQGTQIYIYEAFASYNPAASLHKIPEVLPTYTGIQFDLEIENLDRVLKNTDRPRILLLSGAKDDKKEFVDKFLNNFDRILIGGRLALSFTSKDPKVIPASLTTDTYDIDSVSTERFISEIKQAKVVVMNGPLGKFEDSKHAKATQAVLSAIKSSPAFSLIGGGDTLSAITTLGFSYSDFDFVSTGGGAMLEYLATGSHPLLEVLKKFKNIIQ